MISFNKESHEARQTWHKIVYRLGMLTSSYAGDARRRHSSRLDCQTTGAYAEPSKANTPSLRQQCAENPVLVFLRQRYPIIASATRIQLVWPAPKYLVWDAIPLDGDKFGVVRRESRCVKDIVLGLLKKADRLRTTLRYGASGEAW
jgi:hypothetical protein